MPSQEQMHGKSSNPRWIGCVGSNPTRLGLKESIQGWKEVDQRPMRIAPLPYSLWGDRCVALFTVGSYEEMLRMPSK